MLAEGASGDVERGGEDVDFVRGGRRVAVENEGGDADFVAAGEEGGEGGEGVVGGIFCG